MQGFFASAKNGAIVKEDAKKSKAHMDNARSKRCELHKSNKAFCRNC